MLRIGFGLLAFAFAVQDCSQAPVAVGPDGGGPSHDAGPDSGSTPPAAARPQVTLLVDSSGSMETMLGCTCTTLGCTECLPDCAQGQQTRWLLVLAALTGSYEHFSCIQLDRTAENGATYDEGYKFPHFALGPDVVQRADGVLDRYAARIDFGLATFDGQPTYLSAPPLVPLDSFQFDLSDDAPGAFSFGGHDASGPRVRPDGSVVGKIRYPTTTTNYWMDTGVVASTAPAGALTLPSERRDTAYLAQQLRDLRPFGGTPIAAALDDLYFAYAQADALEPQPSPTRYVVLITDGAPDDDFRIYPTPGCDCPRQGNCPSGEDPSLMSCPYPTAPDAAHHLRCGFAADGCDHGLVKRIYTIGLTSDVSTRAGLDELALEAGQPAQYAETAEQLDAALDGALEQIATDAGGR